MSIKMTREKWLKHFQNRKEYSFMNFAKYSMFSFKHTVLFFYYAIKDYIIKKDYSLKNKSNDRPKTKGN